MKDNRRLSLLAISTVVCLLCTTGIIAIGENLAGDEGTESSEDAVVSTVKSRVTDTPTPVSAEDFELLWSFSASDGDWASVPSTGTIAGNYFYFRQGAAIYKMDISTGAIVASAPSIYQNFMYGHYVDYVDLEGGLIIDNPNNTVYDLNLNPQYKLPSSSTSAGHDGYLYVLSLDDDALYKYDPSVDGMSSSDVKSYIWRADLSDLGLYVRYPVYVDGYAYLSTTENIVSVNLETGTIVSIYDISDQINNELTYSNGHIYAITYDGGIFSTSGDPNVLIDIPVNIETGEFDSDNIRTLTLTGWNNSSSLLIYGNLGFYNSEGAFDVIDLDSWEVIASTDGTKVGRGNMAMTTYYATEEYGNMLYFYVVPYNNYVQIVVYSYDLDDGTVSRNAIDDIGNQQYCTETVQLGPNGELIWHNDSMTIFCYVNSSISRETYMTGDVNTDGAVDLNDALVIARYVLGTETLSTLQLDLADVNDDGMVDLRDAIVLINNITHTYPVSFTVTDESGDILENYTVTIYYDEGMTSATSGTILPQGTYWYHITSNGYDSASGTFTISDAAVEVEVTLYKEFSDDVFTISDGFITRYSGTETNLTIPSTIAGQTVTGISSLAFSNSNIETLTLPDTIKTIQANSFYGSRIEIINIGAGVTSIDDAAFDQMSYLIAINVDSSNRVYSSVTGILYNKAQTEFVHIPNLVSDIEIPGTIAEIETRLFQSLENLTTVKLNYGTQTIGSYAFYRSGLESIEIPDSVTSIGLYALAYTNLSTVVIPGSVASIEQSILYSCTSLTTVILNEGTTSIHVNAFYNCTSLKYLVLPEGLTRLYPSALTNTSIESLTLPSGVTLYGDLNLASLKNLSIGAVGSTIRNLTLENLEHLIIRSDADVSYILSQIGNWPNISSISVEEGSDTMSSTDGILLSADGTTLLAYPVAATAVSYTIPETVVVIGESAFENNRNLTRVYIPGNVTTIERSAFAGCASLTDIIFMGERIESIAEEALNSDASDIRVYALDTFDWNGQDTDFTVFEATIIQIVIFGEVVEEFIDIVGGDYDLINISLKYSNHVWAVNGEVYTSDDIIEITAGMTIQTDNLGMDLNGTLTVIYGVGEDGSLVIPNEIYGHMITALADGLFDDVTGISSLVFPDTVTTLQDSALYGNTDIISVNLGGITTVGQRAFYGCSSLTTVDFGSVTNLGYEAFRNCTSLDNVYLPDTLTTLGDAVFRGCSSLTNVHLGESLEAIPATTFNSTSIVSITIPDSVISITGNALPDTLSEIHIGSGLQSFSMQGFSRSNLTTVTLSSDNEHLELVNGALVNYTTGTILGLLLSTNEFTVPTGLTIISDYAFNGFSELHTINFGNITYIGDYAFQGTGITSASIPAGVTYLGNYAFQSCSSLETVTIGEGLTNISSYAFHSCDALISVTLPSTVTTVETSAFRYCSNLESINLEYVTTLEQYAFANCDMLDNIVLAEGLTELPTGIFRNDSSLKSVTFPSTITTIGAYSFYNTALTSVDLPDGLTTIENSAFRNTNIEWIIIPDSVTSMGTYTFAECSSLEYIVIGSGVTSLSSYALNTGTDTAVFFTGNSAPSSAGSLPTTATVYSYGGYDSFVWGSAWNNYEKSTFWWVTFVVDGESYTAAIPSGTVDLSDYAFLYGGVEVPSWTYDGGTTDGVIEIAGDIVLTGGDEQIGDAISGATNLSTGQLTSISAFSTSPTLQIIPEGMVHPIADRDARLLTILEDRLIMSIGAPSP